jgi:hypothetical protein
LNFKRKRWAPNSINLTLNMRVSLLAWLVASAGYANRYARSNVCHIDSDIVAA